MKRKVIIGLIALLLSVDVYAGGGNNDGGGSFDINVLSSIRKFGIKTTSNMLDNRYGSDIIGEGEVTIRYRWWWLVRTWNSGYAKISLKEGRNAYKAKTISIEQGLVTRDNTHIIHHKTLSKNNVSSFQINLDEYLGKIAVNFVVVGKTGNRVERIVFNDWIND
jgi:hypothetical protein